MKFISLFILLILCIIILIFYNQENKKLGNIGESLVIKELDKLDSNYSIKNNVHIGGSQIDHLVKCKNTRTIFVIETKYWGGTITGKRGDKYWKQLYNGSVKMLYNPVRQNSVHCKNVKRFYFGYDVINLVVFSSKCVFPATKNCMFYKDLVPFILSF